LAGNFEKAVVSIRAVSADVSGRVGIAVAPAPPVRAGAALNAARGSEFKR
jgi:hypothetical protein